MTSRKRMDEVKTGEESLPRDQRRGGPLTAGVASGMKVARVRSWLEHGTWEPVASMPREKPRWKPHEGLSIDAGHRGGWARCSGEVPVMGMERRGPITPFRRGVNPAMGRNPAGKRGRRPGDKSRMSRESHVRFREGLGVKLPRATRPVATTPRCDARSGLPSGCSVSEPWTRRPARDNLLVVVTARRLRLSWHESSTRRPDLRAPIRALVSPESPTDFLAGAIGPHRRPR